MSSVFLERPALMLRWLPSLMGVLASASVYAGDISFDPLVTIGALPHPVNMTVADVNCDGLPDVIVAHNEPGEHGPAVYFGDGLGHLTAPVVIGPALNLGGASAVAAADLDGDGDTDIVFGAGAHLYLLVNDGAGGFTSTQFPRPSTGIQQIAIWDYDNDSRPDIFFSRFGPILGGIRNEGNLSFSILGEQPINDDLCRYRNHDLLLADIDSDGHPELVAISSCQDSIVAFPYNQASGRFDRRPTNGLGHLSGAAFGDLNNDGHADIVALRYPGWGVKVALNDGMGGFDLLLARNGSQKYALTTARADFDSDGYLDAVFGGGGGMGIEIWRNDGDGFRAGPSDGTPFLVNELLTTDLDGDGKPDIVATMQDAGSYLVGVLRNVSK